MRRTARIGRDCSYYIVGRASYTANDVDNWCRKKYGEDWDKKKKAKRKAEARFALSYGKY
tara:strand:+ start:1139 stop:1318 length:180 start_codon:yes stop_codon:yes gene_type:complete